MATSVPPKTQPIMPRVWLTCSVEMAGRAWYQLSSCAEWMRMKASWGSALTRRGVHAEPLSEQLA